MRAFGSSATKLGEQRGAAGAPVLEELGAGHRTRRAERRITLAQGREQRLDGLVERIGVDERGRRSAVEVREVTDLILDGPTRGWGRALPVGLVERSDDRVERRVLGREVVADRVHHGHRGMDAQRGALCGPLDCV